MKISTNKLKTWEWGREVSWQSRMLHFRHVFNNSAINSSSIYLGFHILWWHLRFHMFVWFGKLAFKYFPSLLNVIKDKRQMPLSVFSSILSQPACRLFLVIPTFSAVFVTYPGKVCWIIFARISCQLVSS